MQSKLAYYHYLAMKGQQAGLTNIAGHSPSAEDKQLQSEIRSAADRIAEALPHLPACQIAEMAGYYSMLYTIGYRKMPDLQLIAEQRDRLLQSWQSGDKTIQESDLYAMLSEAARYPATPLRLEHMRTYVQLRDNWIDQLKRCGTFPATLTYERYRRLALITRENLETAYGPDSADAKARWYEEYKIQDLTKESTPILAAYRQYIVSLFPTVLSIEAMKRQEATILKELLTRCDLDPYDTKAYRLALKF